MEEGVTLGAGVVLGKRTRIRTTDGGQVFIGDGSVLEDDVELLASGGVLRIGCDSFIGRGSQLVSVESIAVGDKVLVAAYVIIRDANHAVGMHIPIVDQGLQSAPVSIGNDVWIGAHAVVTAGSVIARGAVVGANAVVTKDVGEYAVVAGVPARVIRAQRATTGCRQ